MEGLVALILLHIAAPGALAGVGLSLLKRRGPSGLVADTVLGTIGGVGGGLLAMGMLQKLQLTHVAAAEASVWFASALLALAVIAMARGTAVILAEATETAA